MKRLVLLTALVCCILFANAQKPDIAFDRKIIPFVDGKITYTFIDTVTAVDKAKIYGYLNKWVALNFKSANAVTQLKDLESGQLILKGNSKDTFRWGESSYQYRLSYTISFSIKDEKYKTVINDFSVQIDGGQGWTLEQLYGKVPEEYNYDKMGWAKRNEMLRGKQFLINTDNFAKALKIEVKKFILNDSKDF